MLTLSYLLTLYDLVFSFEVVAVELEENLIKIAVLPLNKTEPQKIEVEYPENLNKTSLHQSYILLRQAHPNPTLIKTVNSELSDEELIAYRVLEDLLSPAIRVCKALCDPSKQLWVVDYIAGRVNYKSLISSSLMGTDLFRLHTAAYYLRHGYCVEEVIGQGFNVMSAEGQQRLITSKTCLCQEFIFDLKRRAPCKHLCLVETFQQYRPLLRTK